MQTETIPGDYTRYGSLGRLIASRAKKLSIFVAVAIGDSLFFSLLDPRKASALLIIIGFGLVVLTWYLLLDLLLALAERAVSFSGRTRRHWRNALTLLGGLLLAMQSIGQLTVKDLLALVPLVLLLAFYVSYQRNRST